MVTGAVATRPNNKDTGSNNDHNNNDNIQKQLYGHDKQSHTFILNDIPLAFRNIQIYLSEKSRIQSSVPDACPAQFTYIFIF